MRRQLLEERILVCPVCVKQNRSDDDGITLQLFNEASDLEGDEIIKGVLLCPSCKRPYPIIDGIPVFTSTQSKYEESTTAEGYIQTHYRDMISRGAILTDKLRELDFTKFYTTPPANNYYTDLVSLLGEAVRPEFVVLDLGCSVGRLTYELAAKSRFVFGVDPAFAQVKLARAILLMGRAKIKPGQRRVSGSMTGEEEIWIDVPRPERPNIEFIVADDETLPFRDEMFDLICSSSVIDRVPDAGAFLSNLSRVTHDGTFFLVTSPFDWDEKNTPKENWLGFGAYDTPKGSSEAALKELLKRHRFVLYRERDIPWITFSDKRHHSVWSVYAGVFEAWRPEIQRLEAPGGISESLVEAYRRVWAESPVYEEDFEPSEAYEALEKLDLLFVAKRQRDGEIIGFAGGTKLTGLNSAQEIVGYQHAYQILQTTLADNHIFYINELGVIKEYEGSGIGGHLLDLLLSYARASGHHTHVLRTSYNNVKALSVYKSRGFSFLHNADGLILSGLKKRRKSGEERTDFRVCLYRVDEFMRVDLKNGRQAYLEFFRPAHMSQAGLLSLAEQISALFARAFWHSDSTERAWPVQSIMRRLPRIALAILAFDASSRVPIGYALFSEVKLRDETILFSDSEGVSGGSAAQPANWQGSGLGLSMLREGLRRIPSDKMAARTQNGSIIPLLRKLHPAQILPIDSTYTPEDSEVLQAVMSQLTEFKDTKIDLLTGICKRVYREGKLGDYEAVVNPTYLLEFEQRMLELDPTWNRQDGDAVLLLAKQLPSPKPEIPG